MKTKLTLIIYFFALHVSFSQTFFNKGYQFGIPPVYLKTIQLPDKGYFLYGGSDYPAAGFMGKIDTNGTMLWGNRYEYSNSSTPPVFWSAILDHNQHVMIATQGSYPNSGSLINADTSGNIIWDLRFNFPITDVLLTSDSNYALLGCQSPAGSGVDAEVQFYKITPAGSVIFGYEYFNTNSFIGYNHYSKYTSGLVEYPDGNYYLLTCVEPGSIFVMKINPTGQLIWNKKYIQLNSYTDSPSVGTWKMILMPDSTLLICGSSYHVTTTQIICFKINLNGNVLWSESYSSGTVKNGVVNAFLNADSTVVLFTALIDSGNYINDHAVLKIDQNGVLLNNFSFRNANDPVYPMWFGQDNYSCYNFIQYAGFDPINNYDTIQITRIDSLFQSPCISDTPGPFTMQNFSVSVLDSFPLVTLPAYIPGFGTLIITPKNISNYDFCAPTGINSLNTDKYDLSVYPDPAQTFINIDFNFPESKIVLLQIINPFGEIIYNEKIRNNESKDSRQINVQKFTAGIYFAHIRTENKVFTKKFIIQ